MSRLSPRPQVTFDDGYADNLLTALPILERYDVAARFFLVAGALGSKTEMWWDGLERLFLSDDNSYCLDSDLTSTNPSTYLMHFRRLRQLESEAREQALDHLFAGKNIPRLARPERRTLSEEEAAMLASSPLAEIGAHTVTHPVLSQLDVETQKAEIINSKREIERIIGAPVSGFAYPNGTDADYSLATVKIVRDAGFAYAYSAFEHRRADPFQMPRIMIRDWDGDHFSEVLAQTRDGV